MDRSSQLRFGFPDALASFEDLDVTAANEAAVLALKRWSDWPGNVLCLVGPPASGLRVLANIWARHAGAKLLSAHQIDALDGPGVEAFSTEHAGIDLADKVTNEAALLAVMNLTVANDKCLLLTARSTPTSWAATSPDLGSRLQAMPTVEILPPDDEMMLRRLQSGCRRHFILLEDETARYIAIRLERSYLAIEDYVRRLDIAVSELGRAPSVHLARSVLEEGAASRPLFDDNTD